MTFDTAAPTTLRDVPDWRYMMQECDELYRYLPAGGSDRIKSHQRKAREAIARLLRGNAELRLQPRAEKPVTAHLRRALDEGKQGALAPAVRALDAVAHDLSWQYGYEKVPKGLTNSYAYAELAGAQGPVVSHDIILGVVLFAPGCTYPAHAHKGITESYVCLSGAVSENHQGVYVPGSMIFNPPEHLHRITVGDREPALLAYAWMGDPADLHQQKMVFTRARPRPPAPARARK
ncbi:dimethylsulfonioproprionate lyase family protein [Sulfitobacter pontiacus]|uniref:dimethylsulfonioproprionate lyase family protein n=3 Tax=Roseobacteraceae TaxID=2854170 RepID=UPI000C6468D2|nr:dimethylsulfonioproprionate lyase family protein [uncultured Sulfitobacter sp.]MAN10762.1 dimethlysulfonioproprionate lyase DddL [Roseobacter sp.]|tara:strand:+ start:5316 stop:6017 length:702 start_codon:yes stop_codon:yes gene_type:complete